MRWLTARAVVREAGGVTTKAGYWIGGAMVAAGVIGAVLVAVLSGLSAVRSVDEFQRVAVPGSATVRLEARKYVIYVEGPGADETVPAVDVAIADTRAGKSLPVKPYGGSLTYSFNTSGSAQATVTPPRAGAYEVRTSGLDESSGFVLALGDSIGGKIVRTVLGVVVVGGVLGVGGIALLIVTAVRRSGRRAQAARDRPPTAAPPARDRPPPPAV